MGDVTAQWLRYHNMVKFFGKSSAASLGDNVSAEQFPGWSLRYSVSDVFHVTSPGVYLNRREFPIDYPTWFTSAGVTAGHDGVVDEALNWIEHVVYPHDATTDRQWYRPDTDTMRISIQIENPDSHQITSRAYVELLSGTVLDSVNLVPSPMVQNNQWLGSWAVPNLEETFKLRVTARDPVTGRSMTIRNAHRCFSSGPIEVVGHGFQEVDTLHAGDIRFMRLSVRNQGLLDTLEDVSLSVVPLDTFVTCTNQSNNVAALPPGAVDWTGYAFRLTVHPSTIGGTTHPLKVDAYSGRWPAWTDTVVLMVHPPVRVAEARRGVLYGAASYLYTVNRDNGMATNVGVFVTGQIHGLAIRPTTRELYGVSAGSSVTNLYRISSQNGAQVLDKILPVPDMRAIAFLSSDTLFGATTSGNLYRIDLAAGTTTAIGPATGSAYSGLSFSRQTGELWASLRQPSENDSLFILNRNTGDATFALRAGWSVIVPSIAFSPTGALYGLLGHVGGYLFRIDSSGSHMVGETWVDRLDAIAMRTDSDAVSVDEGDVAGIPRTFALEQNYPNPFNPETAIKYQLPGQCRVTLTVFDVLGREVTILVNEVKQPGRYKVQWDARGVASGVYFYRLSSMDFVQTRKLMVIR
jgi:hypothetical protein